MSKQDVWMPIVIGDYLGDTQRLTTEQHGAYFLLLMDYWRNGPPPADDAVLCSITRLKLARFRKHKTTLLSFFEERDGKLYQRRVEAEKIRAKQNHERNSARASKAAKVRWHGDNEDAPSNAPSNAPECSSPSPYSVPTEQPGKVDPAKRVFDRGVALLVRTGSSDGAARSFIGSLRKSATDDRLASLIAEAVRLNITQPKAWLTAALQREASEADTFGRSIDRIYGKEAA